MQYLEFYGLLKANCSINKNAHHRKIYIFGIENKTDINSFLLQTQRKTFPKHFMLDLFAGKDISYFRGHFKLFFRLDNIVCIMKLLVIFYSS